MQFVKQMLLGLALAGALAAQTAAPPPAPPELPRQQRVFMLKYADADHVASVLSVFGYGIRSDRNLHVVAVSAPAEAMSAIEDAIKRLDVPTAAPKDIDLVVYMIVASEQASATELPAELQPVAGQMKKIFPYKSFLLLDSILLRTQPGNRASTNGIVVLPNDSRGGERPYSFGVNPTSVTDDANGRLIRLDNLELSLHLPDDRDGRHPYRDHGAGRTASGGGQVEHGSRSGSHPGGDR